MDFSLALFPPLWHVRVSRLNASCKTTPLLNRRFPLLVSFWTLVAPEVFSKECFSRTLETRRATLRIFQLTGLIRHKTIAQHRLLRLTRTEFDKIAPEKMSMLLSGAVAGVAFWTVGMPADVMKSRWVFKFSIIAISIQHNILRLQTDTTGKYKTLKDVAVGVYRDGGLRAFYKGFTPTIMRSAPVNAVCFLFYEITMNLLRDI